jgi:hypothetical protein
LASSLAKHKAAHPYAGLVENLRKSTPRSKDL